MIKEEPRKKNDVRKRGGDKTADKENVMPQTENNKQKQQISSAVLSNKKSEAKKSDKRQKNKREENQMWKKKENVTESKTEAKN